METSIVCACSPSATCCTLTIVLLAAVPQSYQTDWEAILSRSPEPFIASVSKWMYPAAARGAAAVSHGESSVPTSINADGQQEAAGVPVPPPVATLPLVKEVLDTMRARLDALNLVQTDCK